MQVDPTDDENIHFDAYDSMDIEEFDAHFNPALLYESGKVPPGVRIIGVRRDEHGEIVILDGPGNPGAPVSSDDVKKLLGLLMKSTEKITGCDGIVVDVQTEQVYAASLAALLGCVSKQGIPCEEKRSGLGWAVAIVPGIVRDAAEQGRRFSYSQNPMVRTIAAVMCPVMLMTAAFFYLFLHKTSVLPVYTWIATTPGLDYFAGSESTMSIFGFVFTIAGGMAWTMTLLQHLGLIFNQNKVWNYTFTAAVVLDAFFHTHHWLAIFKLAIFTDTSSIAVSILCHVSALVWGTVMSVGWEVLAASSLVLAITLLPAMGWGLLELIRLFGLTFIFGRHGFQRIMDSWTEAEVSQRTQAGPQNIYQDAEGRTLNPDRGYLVAVALVSIGVLIVIGALVSIVVL